MKKRKPIKRENGIGVDMLPVSLKLLGRAVRKIREQRGFTQKEVGKALNLRSTGAMISLFERGKSAIAITDYYKLGELLDFDPNALLWRLIRYQRTRRLNPLHWIFRILFFWIKK